MSDGDESKQGPEHFQSHRNPCRRKQAFNRAEGCVTSSSCRRIRGFVGRSGSGKSTLLHLNAGIDSPTSGVIQNGDQKLTAFSEKERMLFRRKHIGFIFQFFNLIPTLTVKENLALPPELNADGAIDPPSAIGFLLEQLQLADRQESFPDRLCRR